MLLLILVALADALSIHQPIDLLHKRFLTKSIINPLFSPHNQCQSTSGIYCHQFNNTFPVEPSPEYSEYITLIENTIVDQESHRGGRSQLIFYDKLTRQLIDYHFFYQHPENQIPTKFLFDFDTFQLSEYDSTIFDLTFVINPDTVSIIILEEQNYLSKDSDIIVNFLGFTLPDEKQLRGSYSKQEKKLTALYAPQGNFVIANQAQIFFSKAVTLNQFYLRCKQWQKNQIGANFKIKFFINSLELYEMEIKHKEKFNIWLKSTNFNQHFDEIKFEDEVQIDSLIVESEKSPLNENAIKKQLEQEVFVRYSQLKVKVNQEIEKKQTQKKGSNVSGNYQDYDPSVDYRKELEGNYDQSLKKEQKKMIKEEYDVKALDLLQEYLFKLYFLVKQEKEINNEILTPEQIKQLLEKVNMSYGEKERKIFRPIHNMFDKKQYTEDEFLQILGLVMQLHNITEEEMNRLESQYNYQIDE